MIAAAEEAEQWDYVWNYTDGLLSSNGWEKTVSGTASETMESDGLKLTSTQVTGSGSYVRLRNDNYLMSVGEMEVVLVVPQYSTGRQFENNRICLSNGSHGITIYPNVGKWRNMINATPSAGTVLADFAVNLEYTVRLRINNGYASAWINGTRVLTGFNINNSVYSTATAVWSQNQAGGYAIFKSIKILANRVSDYE